LQFEKTHSGRRNFALQAWIFPEQVELNPISHPGVKRFPLVLHSSGTKCAQIVDTDEFLCSWGELKKRNFMHAKRQFSSETTHVIQDRIGYSRLKFSLRFPLLSERLNGGFRLDVVSTRTLRIALLPEDEILLRQKRNALFARSFPDNRLALPDVGIGY
jgi:hypothetical protein